MPPLSICKIAIKIPADKVWGFWVMPEYINHWYTASKEWHNPKVELEFKVSGHFSYRMEVDDGSSGFDFMGTFKKNVLHKQLSYPLEDQRLVEVSFTETTDGTTIKQQFEAERTSPLSKQKLRAKQL